MIVLVFKILHILHQFLKIDLVLLIYRLKLLYFDNLILNLLFVIFHLFLSLLNVFFEWDFFFLLVFYIFDEFMNFLTQKLVSKLKLISKSILCNVVVVLFVLFFVLKFRRLFCCYKLAPLIFLLWSNRPQISCLFEISYWCMIFFGLKLFLFERLIHFNLLAIDASACVILITVPKCQKFRIVCLNTIWISKVNFWWFEFHGFRWFSSPYKL